MRISKLSLIAALVVGGLLACATIVSAQDTPKEGKKGGKGFRSPQERTEQLATELNLTAEQKPKVTAVFEEQQKKMQELRDVPQDQRREKFTAMREETNKKMKEILTPEQWEKYQKAEQQMMERMKGRKGGGQGGEKKSE